MKYSDTWSIYKLEVILEEEDMPDVEGNGSVLVTKRSGELVEFDRDRIKNAINKATVACGEAKVDDALIESIVAETSNEIRERFDGDFIANVENIQDIIEKNLMKAQLFDIAKSFILYRALKQKERNEQRRKKSFLKKLTVKKRNGKIALFNYNKLRNSVARCADTYQECIDTILDETVKNVYDGISSEDIAKCLVLSASSLIEADPNYSKVAARLFLQTIRREVVGNSIESEDIEFHYKEAFKSGIQRGAELNLLNKALLDYDLDKLSNAIVSERDDLFQYIGIQTLYERYLLKDHEQRLELPQAFWMRVAMGLALKEEDKDAKAIEFYNILSTFRFVSSTPTLFHSGMPNPQLSSCYLTTVEDDLNHIFKCIGDNAQLSKWSGGLGNDWTNVRGTGAWINSTNVTSQGVIPFLKIADSTTVAINRSGKRRGATCAYLETWHYDIEDFLDLRKNTGDDRRRTHDMNIANWIPDLFMQRVKEDGDWTLFSPDETPDLHHIYGREFKKKYESYEKKAKSGKINLFKIIPAKKLWRKMLTMLFETGHPWITFKDPCNVRSPQDHVGVVHSSNLCTEITLNTSKDEVAVCNIGSVNLAVHVNDGKLNEDMLRETAATAIRMLDNVIDDNFYPTVEAKNSNLKHRPIGLGMMGYQDLLFILNIPFDTEDAVELSDKVQELISYEAILTSSKLAKEKGSYSSFKGSKWDRGLMPLDTLKMLEEERGCEINVNKKERLDWSIVRNHIKEYGMRNSNTMAIAPTATISNIVGSFPCIEPIYKNVYVKSNISGEFTIINHYLVNELKKLGLWNREMLEDIKYNDGNLQNIEKIPANLKAIHKEAFEIDPGWVIKHAAVRNKWLDQSQSVNIFIKGASGKKLHDTYMCAWESGLKTTYYLRTLAVSQIEKSTLDSSKYGFTQMRNESPVKACRIDNPDCESCQ